MPTILKIRRGNIEAESAQRHSKFNRQQVLTSSFMTPMPQSVLRIPWKGSEKEASYSLFRLSLYSLLYRKRSSILTVSFSCLQHDHGTEHFSMLGFALEQLK